MRPAAEITQWSIVEVDGANHLVGVLLGGHDHLPPGCWMISSRIVAIDEAASIAVTASTGRVYLLREPLAEALPIEAHKLIEAAPRVWRARAKRKADLARRGAKRDMGAVRPPDDANSDDHANEAAGRRRGDS